MRPFHSSAFSPTLNTDYLFHYANALEHAQEFDEAEDFYGFASTLGEILTLPVCKPTVTLGGLRKPYDQQADGEAA